MDITHSDVDKNQLYAAMGVPEFWRYNGREWRIYQLEGNAYQEVSSSPTFAWVKKEDLYHFLEAAQQDEIAAEMMFRDFVRQHLRGEG